MKRSYVNHGLGINTSTKYPAGFTIASRRQVCLNWDRRNRPLWRLWEIEFIIVPRHFALTNKTISLFMPKNLTDGNYGIPNFAKFLIPPHTFPQTVLAPKPAFRLGRKISAACHSRESFRDRDPFPSRYIRQRRSLQLDLKVRECHGELVWRCGWSMVAASWFPFSGKLWAITCLTVRYSPFAYFLSHVRKGPFDLGSSLVLWRALWRLSKLVFCEPPLWYMRLKDVKVLD